MTRSCRGAWEGSRDARATLPATWAALPAGHHLSLAVVLSVAKPTATNGLSPDGERVGSFQMSLESLETLETLTPYPGTLTVWAGALPDAPTATRFTLLIYMPL